MAANKKNYVIRSTTTPGTDVRYVKLSNPALVTAQDADKWTEKQAKACIDDFVKCGEWQAGQYRVEMLHK